MRTIQALAVGLLLCAAPGCFQSSHQRGNVPTGYSQAQMEFDYRECEYKARLANQEHFYSQSSPFPIGSGPQSPADHARALHGISSINAMRDTCLAAKGYRVE